MSGDSDQGSFSPAPRYLVVGAVRNCSGTLRKSVSKLEAALGADSSPVFYFIESDSGDRTLEVLSKLSSSLPAFSFKSLGSLRTEIPDRISRIRFSREEYLKFIKSNKGQFTHCIVADMDGPALSLKRNQIAEALRKHPQFDAIAANSKGRYYDILALRAKGWIEEDYRVIYDALRASGCGKFESKFKSFVRLQKKIKPSSGPLEVESAFGGLAIYQVGVLSGSSYYGANNFECEHVTLHRDLRSQGKRLAVIPELQVRPEIRHSILSSPLVRPIWALVILVERFFGQVASNRDSGT